MTSAFFSGGGFPGFSQGFLDDPSITTDIDELMPGMGMDMSGFGGGGQYLPWTGGGEPRAGPNRRQRRQARREQAGARSIPVNLVEEEERYCACFALPGREKSDICVALEVTIHTSSPSFHCHGRRPSAAFHSLCAAAVLCCRPTC